MQSAKPRPWEVLQMTWFLKQIKSKQESRQMEMVVVEGVAMGEVVAGEGMGG